MQYSMEPYKNKDHHIKAQTLTVQKLSISLREEDDWELINPVQESSVDALQGGSRRVNAGVLSNQQSIGAEASRRQAAFDVWTL